MLVQTPQQLNNLHKKYLANEEKFAKKVLVCCGPGCLASGAAMIVDEFKKLLKKKRIKDFSVEALKETGCHGLCEQGPLVVIEPQGIFYTKVKAKHVEKIIETSIRKDEIVTNLLYTDPKTNQTIERYADIDFYSHQHRIALRHLGKISQYDIRDYIAQGGYQALAKALSGMTPKKIIDEVTKS